MDARDEFLAQIHSFQKADPSTPPAPRVDLDEKDLIRRRQSVFQLDSALGMPIFSLREREEIPKTRTVQDGPEGMERLAQVIEALPEVGVHLHATPALCREVGAQDVSLRGVVLGSQKLSQRASDTALHFISLVFDRCDRLLHIVKTAISTPGIAEAPRLSLATALAGRLSVMQELRARKQQAIDRSDRKQESLQKKLTADEQRLHDLQLLERLLAEARDRK